MSAVMRDDAERQDAQRMLADAVNTFVTRATSIKRVRGLRDTQPGFDKNLWMSIAEQGWLGRGPSVVVTDLGIYHFDESGEMRLDSLHPGATLDEVRATMGWEVRVAATLATTPAPTAEELRLIRAELDPEGIYTK